jgi:mannonate dehydratase
MKTLLEKTWRWFGPNDGVRLEAIRQAGALGVVTALHHVPCGEVWTIDEIRRRQAEVEQAGLRWSVVESVPVHEDIKRWTGQYSQYLDNYCQSLRNLASCGIRVVCYNFMAVTDWTRTNLGMRTPSGGLALRFDMTDAAAFDLLMLKRQGAEGDYPDPVRASAERRWAGMGEEARCQLAKSILLGLPGTVDDFSINEFRDRLGDYKDIDSETLRMHHTRFLSAVIPTAEAGGVVLAIHPDDPPFPIFGLPRIAGSEEDLRRIIESVDSPSNGITFCTGSLGASAKNDLPGMLRRLGHRVYFLHLRSVFHEADGSFFEDDHLAGSSNMVAIMREAIDLARRRGASIPMRPDHGHLIGTDIDRSGYYAGYSYIGRLKGLAELRGLEVGLRAGMQED